MEPIRASGAVSLSFEGRLTVDRAVEIRSRFAEALQGPSPVEVDVRGATEIDITFIQLLFAAHRAASAAGKSLVLSPDHPPAMERLLREAGLCRHAGLCSDSPEPCLWTGGGEP